MDKSKISSLKELEAAQRQLSRQLADKRQQLVRSGRKAKAFYAPANLVGNAFNSIIPVSGLASLAMGLVHGVKKRSKITGKKP